MEGIESNPGPKKEHAPKEDKTNNQNIDIQSDMTTAKENPAFEETVILSLNRPFEVHQNIDSARFWDLPAESTNNHDSQKCSNCDESAKGITRCSAKPESNVTKERGRYEVTPNVLHDTKVTGKGLVRCPPVKNMELKDVRPKVKPKPEEKDVKVAETKQNIKMKTKIKRFFNPFKKSTKLETTTKEPTTKSNKLVRITEEICDDITDCQVDNDQISKDIDADCEKDDQTIDDIGKQEFSSTTTADNSLVKITKKSGAIHIALSKMNVNQSSLDYVSQQISQEKLPVKHVNMSKSTWHDENWCKAQKDLNKFLLQPKLQKIEDMNISYMDLVQVPKAVGEQLHQRLVVLNAGHNKLCTLDVILECTILKRLVVSFNMLTTIPKGITALVLLQEFYIDENPIYEVPACLSECKQLQVLKIGSRNTRVIAPEVFKIKDLKIEVAMKHTKVLCYPTYEQLTDSYQLSQFLTRHNTNLTRTAAKFPKYAGNETKFLKNDNCLKSEKQTLLVGMT